MIHIEPVRAFGDSFCCAHVPAPFKLRDQSRVTDMRRRITVTLKAPAHAERFVLVDNFHGVDSAMTLHTTDATVDVGRVIEVRVVRQIMDLDPLHRHACFVTFMQRGQVHAFGVDLRVAVHARLRWRNRRDRRVLNRVVAVSTVHAEFTGMQSMAKWNRLRRHVSDVGRLRTEPPRHHECHVQRRRSTHHEYKWEDQVRPFGEGVVVSTHTVASGLVGGVKKAVIYFTKWR